MGLLQKIKTALGMDGADSPGSGTASSGPGDVTVEREPSTESEDAVKGTDTSESTSASDAAPGGGAEPDETSSGSHGEPSQTETADATDEADASTPGVGTPVTDIKGIGSTYGSRLEAAGIEDVADLASADAGDLADETGIAQGRIEGWIESAEEF